MLVWKGKKSLQGSRGDMVTLLECDFVFGWLGSGLSWKGSSDEGTGEARRGARRLHGVPPPHPLKQPHILICNICARRAVQNGCSSEDDGRVCSNLGLGHLVLQRFCTDVSVHNVAPSSASVPREGYFKGEGCVFFICSCR